MMDARDARRMDDMQAEITRLRRELIQRPLMSVGGGSTPQFKTANIIGGNTLSTGQTGINYSSSQITTVPSAYDPDVDVTFIDGIGRAMYYIDNSLQSSNILIVNCNNVGSPLQGTAGRALLAGIVVRIIGSTSILVGAGPSTVTAYIIAWL